MRKDFYDQLETRHPDERENELLRRLPDLVALAMSSPGWARQLAGVDPNAVTSRAALAELPLLSVAALAAAKASDPPFGGLANMPRDRLRRVLVSADGVYHPQARGRDWGGAARALFAAGVRSQDVVLNCFSYRRTAASFIMESGAFALGCTVIAAGEADAAQARAAMAALKPSAYVGSADFLERMLARGGAVTLKHALVTDAPLATPQREALLSGGIAAQACCLHPDVGVIAYESDASEGMIVNEGLMVEVVRPGDGAVDDRETGEIVVTAFNPDYPMIRLAIGSRAAVVRGRSPCGRTNMRIRLTETQRENPAG